MSAVPALTPALCEVKALDGRIFAMLTTYEARVLDFYRQQGRRFGVTVAIINKADSAELASARSEAQADEIMKRSNSRVSVSIDPAAESAWAAKVLQAFYEPSARALAALESRFFMRVEPHDGRGDEDTPDLLWLEFTPDDHNSAGVVLSISPATADRMLWSFSMDEANRYGGWVTLESATGTADEIIARIQDALASQKWRGA